MYEVVIKTGVLRSEQQRGEKVRRRGAVAAGKGLLEEVAYKEDLEIGGRELTETWGRNFQVGTWPPCC